MMTTINIGILIGIIITIITIIAIHKGINYDRAKGNKHIGDNKLTAIISIIGFSVPVCVLPMVIRHFIDDSKKIGLTDNPLSILNISITILIAGVVYCFGIVIYLLLIIILFRINKYKNKTINAEL